jgi:hypothetical protein
MRRNDLDGRGHFSEENLATFTRFFLTTCLDQVAFMEGLMQPDQLRARILLWTELVGTGERQARRVVSALIERGVLLSESTRAPLRLAFPATLAARWMPGLFPEKNG